MQRHRIDLLSLLLGALAIALAVAGFSGTITAEWLDPNAALSIAALVGVAVVAAAVANLVVRRGGSDATDLSPRLASDHDTGEAA